MFKAVCDTCKAPLEPEDNHIEIQAMGIIDKKQIMQGKGLHFCGKSCLNKWVDNALDRPVILPANGMPNNRIQ
jgi:hypothetical protein